MKDQNEIFALVRRYQAAIHTQDIEAFKSLWTGKNNTLISITDSYSGLDSITRDFLIGGIQGAYERIELIAEDIQVRFVAEELAIVIFQYRTECVRRETGESYGIRGLETQVVQKVDGQWKLVHVHYSK
ncbi:DUF4440 domain-containing protein [Dubosiella muris]|uniref:YybH family protein n=2 Tax=Dubosiella TaxID=1937008 RepID=UPI0014414906|nr:nuclear transport factor 2 family protein [Dubosiella muris]